MHKMWIHPIPIDLLSIYLSIYLISIYKRVAIYHQHLPFTLVLIEPKDCFTTYIQSQEKYQNLSHRALSIFEIKELLHTQVYANLLSLVVIECPMPKNEMHGTQENENFSRVRNMPQF